MHLCMWSGTSELVGTCPLPSLDLGELLRSPKLRSIGHDPPRGSVWRSSHSASSLPEPLGQPGGSGAAKETVDTFRLMGLTSQENGFEATNGHAMHFKVRCMCFLLGHDGHKALVGSQVRHLNESTFPAGAVIFDLSKSARFSGKDTQPSTTKRN